MKTSSRKSWGFFSLIITAALCSVALIALAAPAQAEARDSESAPVQWAYLETVTDYFDIASAYGNTRVNVTYKSLSFRTSYEELEPTQVGYDDYGFSIVYNASGQPLGTVWTNLTHYRANYRTW